MVGKKVVKKASSKGDVMDKILANNLILVKKETELIKEVKELTVKVNSLVGLFEKAAKMLEKGETKPITSNQELVRKMETVLGRTDQASKGLLLLEKYVRDKALAETAPKKSSMPSQEY